MTRKFYQSEQGNITLLALDNTLLIWTDTAGSFLVTNPSNPGVYSSGTGEIDVPEKATASHVLEMIRAQTGKTGWGANRPKVPVFLVNEFRTESGPGELVEVDTLAFSSKEAMQEYIATWVDMRQKMGCIRVPDEEFKFYAPKDYILWLEFPEIQFV